jgi:Ca2+/Na+ antiporter
MVAGNGQIDGFDNDTEQRDILKLSHGTAIVLLFSQSRPFWRPSCLLTSFLSFQVYISYLVFQLFSHKSLYDDESGQKFQSTKYPVRTGPSAKDKTKKLLGFGLSPVKETKEDGSSVGPGDSSAHINRRNTEDSRQIPDEEQPGAAGAEEDDQDEEMPELSLPVTIGLLIIVTILVAVTAEWLVSSIDGLASGGAISKEFIGLILLPIVGNAAEHVTAVTVSIKDKLTLSLGVAVGSSIVSPRISGNAQHLQLTLAPLANRLVRHPVHHHPWMDHRSSDHHALRPIRVCRPLPLRADRQLCRTRWKIKLAGRHDLDMLVRLGSFLSHSLWN